MRWMLLFSCLFFLYTLFTIEPKKDCPASKFDDVKKYTWDQCIQVKRDFMECDRIVSDRVATLVDQCNNN